MFEFQYVCGVREFRKTRMEFERSHRTQTTHSNCIPYPGRESNPQDLTIIGFWDRRVYQFRHPGKMECESKENWKVKKHDRFKY